MKSIELLSEIKEALQRDDELTVDMSLVIGFGVKSILMSEYCFAILFSYLIYTNYYLSSMLPLHP